MNRQHRAIIFFQNVWPLPSDSATACAKRGRRGMNDSRFVNLAMPHSRLVATSQQRPFAPPPWTSSGPEFANWNFAGTCQRATSTSVRKSADAGCYVDHWLLIISDESAAGPVKVKDQEYKPHKRGIAQFRLAVHSALRRDRSRSLQIRRLSPPSDGHTGSPDFGSIPLAKWTRGEADRIASSNKFSRNNTLAIRKPRSGSV
jgi:hypothetical protein